MDHKTGIGLVKLGASGNSGMELIGDGSTFCSSCIQLGGEIGDSHVQGSYLIGEGNIGLGKLLDLSLSSSKKVLNVNKVSSDSVQLTSKVIDGCIQSGDLVS